MLDHGNPQAGQKARMAPSPHIPTNRKRCWSGTARRTKTKHDELPWTSYDLWIFNILEVDAISFSTYLNLFEFAPKDACLVDDYTRKKNAISQTSHDLFRVLMKLLAWPKSKPSNPANALRGTRFTESRSRASKAAIENDQGTAMLRICTSDLLLESRGEMAKFRALARGGR